MLSQDTLKRYRQMSVDERWQLTLNMIRDNMPALLEGSPELVARRFERLRRENDARNRNMLTAIARTVRTDVAESGHE